MAGKMKRAYTSVTDYVFPPPKAGLDPSKQHLLKTGNVVSDNWDLNGVQYEQGHEYVTSLPLQMCLFFNSFYFPLWLITMIVMFVAKYESLDTLYRIVIIAILSVMLVIECVRLYLGYVGNLNEQVPELAGFWMLTLLLQTPLNLFLLFNEATIITPLERAVCIVMSLFVLLEVIIGYFAIRTMVNYQVTKFHLQQFSDVDNQYNNDIGYTNNGFVYENKYNQ